MLADWALSTTPPKGTGGRMPDTSSNGTRRRRFWSRGDLPPIARPAISPEQWRDHGQALGLLRTWAEDRATETINWYLRDKKTKRWASRLLRAAAVITAAAGGVLPLISGSVHGVNSNLGYIFLAVAAACVAFDHFFGLSSGWMRDIAALQALQGQLTRFQLDWARWEAAQAGVLGVEAAVSPSEAMNVALELIDALAVAVAQVTEAETAQWITDFSSSVASLRQQASPSVASPQDLITWSKQGDLSSS
jgi:SMODS and SLOG-associating 2TM effector domain 2